MDQFKRQRDATRLHNARMAILKALGHISKRTGISLLEETYILMDIIARRMEKAAVKEDK